MAIIFYDQSIAVLTHGLRAMSTWLDKARAHAEQAGYDANILCATRLFPDMLPLSRQVQIATDMSKGGASRLAGVEVPKLEDTETTLDEIQARIHKVLDYLAAFAAHQFDGADSRAVEISTPKRSYQFNGKDYLIQWVLPNFYFHLTTVYNLLRHNGVPLGKMDFLAID